MPENVNVQLPVCDMAVSQLKRLFLVTTGVASLRQEEAIADFADVTKYENRHLAFRQLL